MVARAFSPSTHPRQPRNRAHPHNKIPSIVLTQIHEPHEGRLRNQCHKRTEHRQFKTRKPI